MMMITYIAKTLSLLFFKSTFGRFEAHKVAERFPESEKCLHWRAVVVIAFLFMRLDVAAGRRFVRK